MKGRAFEKAVNLSGGKAGGLMLRFVYIGVGSSVISAAARAHPTDLTLLTAPVNAALTTVLWPGSSTTGTTLKLENRQPRPRP